MPNWCMNTVEWTGNPEEQEKVLALIKTGDNDFDFNAILPYPEEYAKADAEVERLGKEGVEWKNMPPDGFNHGGYEWCLANWGTKWNACEAISDLGVASFDTAWSPPEPVICALSKMFPELTFTLRYEEGGMDFSGYCVYRAGNLLDSAEGDYDDYPITEHPHYCKICGEEFWEGDTGLNFETGICEECAKKQEAPE